MYRVSHFETDFLNWLWGIEGPISFFWFMVPSGFRRCGYLCFINQFSKKWPRLASTASDRKSIKYQWKFGFSMINSKKRDCWVLGMIQPSGWNFFFWWNEAVEVIEATEAVEAVEVIEASEVLRSGKSLLMTSVSSWFLNLALIWCFEKKMFW